MSEKYIDPEVVREVSEKDSKTDFEVGHGQDENLTVQFGEVKKVRQGLHQRHIQVSHFQKENDQSS